MFGRITKAREFASMQAQLASAARRLGGKPSGADAPAAKGTLRFINVIESTLLFEQVSPGHAPGDAVRLSRPGGRQRVESRLEAHPIGGAQGRLRLVRVPEEARGFDPFVLVVNGERIGPIRLPRSRFVGAIDSVGAGFVRGWALPVYPVGDAPQEYRLLVDGVEAGSLRCDGYREDLSPLLERTPFAFFSVPIPPSCFDGREHVFAFAPSGGSDPIASHRWRYAYELRWEEGGSDRLRGWCFDPAAPLLPVPLEVRINGAEVIAVPTEPRLDVQAALGAVASGFSVAIPPHARTVEIGPAGVDGVAFANTIHRARVETMTALIEGWSNELRRKLDDEDDAPSAAWLLTQAIPSLMDQARSRASDGGRSVTFGTTTRRGGAKAASVAVVMPVYDGYEETVACLESVVRHTAGHRIICVYDAGPDPRILDHLKSLHADGRIELVVNPTNLGFVQSVNLAVALCLESDVVALNADTVVPAGWIERLHAAAYGDPTIASVTPFSNNATICSYPLPVTVNPLPPGMSADDLDRLFQKVTADPIEIPVGVGFCMYMKRDAIRSIGVFAAEWGRGYCEEVDWCMRARQNGWRHVAAPNLFVYHHGGVSFGEGSKVLLDENHRTFSKRYPEYDRSIVAFVKQDPLSRCRMEVDVERLRADGRPIVFIVEHGLGGGTNHYVASLSAMLAASGYNPLVARTMSQGADTVDRIEITNPARSILLRLGFDDLRFFINACAHADLLAFAVLNTFNAGVVACVEALAANGVPYDVIVHDYVTVCPRVHMLDRLGRFCGGPARHDCGRTVVGAGAHESLAGEWRKIGSIEGWRAAAREMCREARAVIAPSEAAAAIVREVDLGRDIVVFPHAERERRASIRFPALGDRTLHLLLLGAIGEHKGLGILKGLVDDAEERELPVHFHVLGMTADDPWFAGRRNATIYGPYLAKEVGQRIASIRPDYSLMLSVWPETYSYVTSESWAAGLPVICFDLGAPAERVRAQGGGFVIPLTYDVRTVNDEILRLARDATEEARAVEITPNALEPRSFYPQGLLVRPERVRAAAE